MKVLIIENDPAANEALGAALTVHRLEVESAKDGHTGLSAARAGSFDLILLEVMLPCLDGFSLLQSLRQAGNHTPVIFLTARNAVQDRIRGLELGADDYVAKPFSPGEILARIKAVLRRTSGGPRTRDALIDSARVMRIADLEIDLHRHRASRAGRSLELTPKEFSLLSLLARWRGKVLTRPFIASEVWDTSLDKYTNVVNVHIRRLRSKLDDPFGQKLVTTVRGVGYMLSDNASASAESLGT